MNVSSILVMAISTTVLMIIIVIKIMSFFPSYGYPLVVAACTLGSRLLIRSTSFRASSSLW